MVLAQFPREPGQGVARPVRLDESYDAVVVGSGLGGLTTASLLAAAGRRVLVVERHDRVGGYAHSFRRHQYRFDSSVHLIGGCSSDGIDGGGLIDRVIGAVGALGACEFVAVDPFYRAYYPEFSINIPIGLSAFVDAHAELFPAERPGVERLMRLCGDIRDETDRASSAKAAGHEVRLLHVWEMIEDDALLAWVEDNREAETLVATIFSAAADRGFAEDGVRAESLDQAATLWRLRESL